MKPGAEVHWDEFKQNGTTPAALSKQYIVQPFVITSVSTTARGENLYEAAPLAAHVNLPSDMSLLSPIKFKPQTRVIKLSKAHKANPRVYRIVENELLHDTRPDTSLAPDTVNDSPKELDNNDSDGSITPTQASFDKSQARRPTSASPMPKLQWS